MSECTHCRRTHTWSRGSPADIGHRLAHGEDPRHLLDDALAQSERLWTGAEALRAALVEAEEFLRELNGYGFPMREAARERVLNRVRAALEAKP